MGENSSETAAKLATLIRPGEQPPRTLSSLEREILAFDLEQRHTVAKIRVECGSGIVVMPPIVEDDAKPKKKKKRKRSKKKTEQKSEGPKPLTEKQKQLAEKVEKLKAKQGGKSGDS